MSNKAAVSSILVSGAGNRRARGSLVWRAIDDAVAQTRPVGVTTCLKYIYCILFGHRSTVYHLIIIYYTYTI